MCPRKAVPSYFRLMLILDGDAEGTVDGWTSEARHCAVNCQGSPFHCLYMMHSGPGVLAIGGVRAVIRMWTHYPRGSCAV